MVSREQSGWGATYSIMCPRPRLVVDTWLVLFPRFIFLGGKKFLACKDSGSCFFCCVMKSSKEQKKHSLQVLTTLLLSEKENKNKSTSEILRCPPIIVSVRKPNTNNPKAE